MRDHYRGLLSRVLRRRLWQVGNDAGVALFYLGLALALAVGVIGIFSGPASKNLQEAIAANFGGFVPALVLLGAFFVYAVARENYEDSVAEKKRAAEAVAERDGLNATLQTLMESGPRLDVDGSSCELFGEPPKSGMYVAEVRIKNTPVSRFGANTASRVRPHIQVVSPDGAPVIERTGQWIDERRQKAVKDAGPIGPLAPTLAYVDINPHEYEKVPVLVDIRIPAEADGWYLYESASYLGHSSVRFPRGSYRVRLRLTGGNFDPLDFWFTLDQVEGEKPRLTRLLQ